MLSRCLALLWIPTLPFAPLMVPFAPARAANVVVAGIVATVLALFSLVNNRARFAVGFAGAWVALTPFIFNTTLPEEVITVVWGVSTMVFMAGPFSDRPRVYRTPAAATTTDAAAGEAQRNLPIAA